MRRFSYILILCCTLLLPSGCGKDAVPGLPDGGEEIVLPDGGPYIYLDAMVDKSTRSAVVEGTELQAGFGAYGFTYDFTNRWTTYRITATPNVFKNAGGTFIAPQQVTYADGIYSYSPVQTWQGGKYTFFAYYPYNNQYVTPSDINVTGTPYVEYAPADFLTSTANHADVLTAMFEDTSLSSSKYVDFDFEHRLSAVEIVALNFYMYNHDNGAGGVESEQITIEITDLQVTFNNLDYKAAKFYLDSSIAPECTAITAGDGTPTYDVIDAVKNVTYNSSSEFQRVAENQAMLLIPQADEDLEVTTIVKYRKLRPGGAYLAEDPDADGTTRDGDVYTTTKTTTFGQALKAGSRYYIQLTFTSSAVSINIVTSAEWEDLAVDVYHEFE